MKFQQYQKGFTLIELVAATTLLALAFGILLPVIGKSVRLLARAEINNRMSAVARSVIDDASQNSSCNGITQGERDGLHWYLECKKASASKGATLLMLRLTLTSGNQVEVFLTAHLQPLEQAKPQ